MLFSVTITLLFFYSTYISCLGNWVSTRVFLSIMCAKILLAELELVVHPVTPEPGTTPLRKYFLTPLYPRAHSPQQKHNFCCAAFGVIRMRKDGLKKTLAGCKVNS